MSFIEFGDKFHGKAFSEDVFGEESIGKRRIKDPVNTYLFFKLMRNYLKWHEDNGNFYSNYDSDKSRLKFLQYQSYGWALTGFFFAGMVINPNYSSSRAFYLRKFNALLFSWLGYTYGQKKVNTHLNVIMMRLNDYLPMEIKRALASKDYRYIALFDYENEKRQLFDNYTGKSLS